MYVVSAKFINAAIFYGNYRAILLWGDDYLNYCCTIMCRSLVDPSCGVIDGRNCSCFCFWLQIRILVELLLVRSNYRVNSFICFVERWC